MKAALRLFLFGICAVLLAAPPGRAAVLLQEDFSRFDVQAPPKGWTVSEQLNVSIVPESGHGNVLKIKQKEEKTSGAYYAFDAAQVAGKMLKISVQAKFTGTATSIATKLWAVPKLLIEAKDKSGQTYTFELCPAAATPGWQTLPGTFRAPKETVSARLGLIVPLVTAEIEFGSVTVSADAGEAAPPPGGTQQPGAGKQNFAAVTPLDAKHEEAIKAAPKRTLDDGMVFSPDIARKLQKMLLPPAVPMAKNTAAWAGPGVPAAETKVKGWTFAPARLNGQTPLALLATLPEFILKEKPEVLLLAGDASLARQPGANEKADWEDVEKLCARMGVLPVVVVPAPAGKEDKDAVYTALTKLLDEYPLPAISAKPPEQFNHRVEAVLTLLDRHVFCRKNEDKTKVNEE